MYVSMLCCLPDKIKYKDDTPSFCAVMASSSFIEDFTPPSSLMAAMMTNSKYDSCG